MLEAFSTGFNSGHECVEIIRRLWRRLPRACNQSTQKPVSHFLYGCENSVHNIILIEIADYVSSYR